MTEIHNIFINHTMTFWFIHYKVIAVKNHLSYDKIPIAIHNNIEAYSMSKSDTEISAKETDTTSTATNPKQLKDTVFLPKTSFPMKGDMVNKDLEILETWKQNNLYEAIRSKSNGRQKYILHYGPPYANGQIHIGHALSGVLKDAFNKAHQMLWCDAPMVIGV